MTACGLQHLALPAGAGVIAALMPGRGLAVPNHTLPRCHAPAEIVAIAVEECFDDLDAPPERVTGAEVPMPYAANLEAAALPQVEHIVSTVKRMMNRQ